MINRGRDGAVNAGAVSEGATVFSESTSSAVQPHGGDRSHGHRILTAHDSEICFASCARPILGLRAPRGTRNPPPQSRLQTRNLAAALSLLAREVPRPTAASARRSEYDSAAAVVGSDRTLALNVERAGSLASHGKARSRFVAHFNAFTRMAII